jgi:hypothetical protein
VVDEAGGEEPAWGPAVPDSDLAHGGGRVLAGSCRRSASRYVRAARVSLIGREARRARRRRGRPRWSSRTASAAASATARGPASAWTLRTAGRLACVGGRVVAAHGGGDLGQVARTGLGGRGRRRARCRRTGVDRGRGCSPRRRRSRGGEQAPAQVLVERGDAVVVEPGRLVPNTGMLVVGRGRTPRGCAAPACARRAGRRAPRRLELVDRHEVGEVEHVDLLELARRRRTRGSSRRAPRRRRR